MVSGMCVISEAIWGCYPFIESVTSFLPVVDELVVIVNPYGKDDTETVIRETFASESKVRVVHTYFNIEQLGWKSYGIARTTGYQACHGDIVLMFDADGVLHEKDVHGLRNTLSRLSADNDWHNAYWEKYRIFTPKLYWAQHKHSGIYNKKRMGDRFDFYNDDGRGIPSWGMIHKTEQEKSVNTGVYLFGYEHTFDTQDVIKTKAARYGRMIDTQHHKELLTDDEYYEVYITDLLANYDKKGEKNPMPISSHPSIMQPRLNSLSDSQFGYNLFGKFTA